MFSSTLRPSWWGWTRWEEDATCSWLKGHKLGQEPEPGWTSSMIFAAENCLFVYSESSRLRKVQLKDQYTKYWLLLKEEEAVDTESTCYISPGDYDEHQNHVDEYIPPWGVKCSLAVISGCFLHGVLWPFPVNRDRFELQRMKITIDSEEIGIKNCVTF